MHLKIINYIQVNTRFFKHCLQPRILGSLSCWPCVVTVRNIFVYMYFLFCFVSLNINIHDTHFTLMLIQFHSIFTHSKSAETRQNNQRVKNKRVFFFPKGHTNNETSFWKWPAGNIFVVKMKWNKIKWNNTSLTKYTVENMTEKAIDQEMT